MGKFDDADDADGDHMVTIWATIPQGLSHGKTASKKRGGEVVKLSVKVRLIGDSSPCSCLARAKGTPASWNKLWL